MQFWHSTSISGACSEEGFQRGKGSRHSTRSRWVPDVRMVRRCYLNTSTMQTDPSSQRLGVALEGEASEKYQTRPAPHPDDYLLQSSHP